MDQKKKRMLLFLGSLFVAVIFLSSYASFGNNGTGTTSTTTAKPEQSFPAFGNSSATVTGYGFTAQLRLGANSSSVESRVANTLSSLQSNGSINNYIGSDGGYEVYLSSINAYSLQGILQSAANQSNAIALTAPSYVELPANVTLYYNTVPIDVRLSGRNYSVNMTGLQGIGSSVNVSIAALVTNNRTVYNNELSISLRR